MTQLTNQQLFDNALNGIRAQQYRKSLAPNPGASDKTMCAYRGHNGCKCAIGHSIPDELYGGDMMENRGPGRLVQVEAYKAEYTDVPLLFTYKVIALKGLLGNSPERLSFLSQLQRVHDEMTSGEHFEKGMQAFAAKYALVYTPVEA